MLRALVLACLAAAVTAGCADAKTTTWLCRPGLAHNPCTPNLTATVIAHGRQTIERPRRATPVECFYVYPTVSGQAGPQANLHVDPAERTVARIQAGRFSQVCRVWAPMYRQITRSGLIDPASVTPAMQNRAYADVRAAWREYLARDNHGRGVVLIGHSQGTFMLRRLVAEEIDRNPAARRRLVSAILLGGNVTRGEFKHIGACRSPRQTRCVIACSSFAATAPANSLFGRASGGREVLCTNPAALAGGSGKLSSYFPRGNGWLGYRDAYRASCSTAGGASVLLVTPLDGAPPLVASPGPVWGLHRIDINLALGNLVALVRSEAAARR
jgi:hypothetical protein